MAEGGKIFSDHVLPWEKSSGDFGDQMATNANYALSFSTNLPTNYRILGFFGEN